MPNKMALGPDISLFDANSTRAFYRDIVTNTKDESRRRLEQFQKDFTLWWTRWQTITALASLDPQMLQDLGLTGVNIRDFVNDPNNADPRLRL